MFACVAVAAASLFGVAEEADTEVDEAVAAPGLLSGLDVARALAGWVLARTLCICSVFGLAAEAAPEFGLADAPVLCDADRVDPVRLCISSPTLASPAPTIPKRLSAGLPRPTAGLALSARTIDSRRLDFVCLGVFDFGPRKAENLPASLDRSAV